MEPRRRLYSRHFNSADRPFPAASSRPYFRRSRPRARLTAQAYGEQDFASAAAERKRRAIEAGKRNREFMERPPISDQEKQERNAEMVEQMDSRLFGQLEFVIKRVEALGEKIKQGEATEEEKRERETWQNVIDRAIEEAGQ